MMLSTRILPNTITQLRNVSSKYIRPHPRHYKRRLFEAALAPVVQAEKLSCEQIIEAAAMKKKMAKEEYMPIELALADKVKSWIIKEDFKLIAVCQLLPVTGRQKLLACNQLRLKNLEVKTYGNKIMKKVFEGTAVETLNVMLQGNNAVVYGKDINSLKSMMTELNKLSWLTPLAVVIDDTIIAVKEAEALAKLPSLDGVRAEIVQILSKIPMDTVSHIEHHVTTLGNTLEEVSKK
uniref:39S ribosomal protein L10, mitochondrial n=1 Tax=Rhabditophanes sp. KR3021 TaxID=114890 RepID=A0AC35UF31_9BILA